MIFIISIVFVLLITLLSNYLLILFYSLLYFTTHNNNNKNQSYMIKYDHNHNNKFKCHTLTSTIPNKNCATVSNTTPQLMPFLTILRHKITVKNLRNPFSVFASSDLNPFLEPYQKTKTTISTTLNPRCGTRKRAKTPKRKY